MPRYNNNGPGKQNGFLKTLKQGLKTIKDEITGGGDPFIPPMVETATTRAFDAIQRGDVSAVEKALKEDPTIIHKYNKGYQSETLLHIAVRRSDVDMAKMLLKKGAKVDAPRRDDGTSTMGGYTSSTAGMEKQLASYSGGTALFVAVRQQNKDLVKLLLENGADPNVKNNGGATVLHAAAETGALEIVKLLTDKKRTKIDIVDDRQNSALLYAVTNKRHEVVEHLVKAGADPKSVNRQGQTFLHIAVHNADKKMVDFFLGQGVDVNAANNQGRTALDMAVPKTTAYPGAPYRGQYDIVRRLIKAGADVDRQCRDHGTTILHEVAQGAHVDLVQDILAAGADPDICADDGETALIKSVKRYRDGMNTQKHADTIGMLLHYGASVEERDAKGYTALIYACEHGQTDLVKTLLKHKADVHAKTVDGRSALTQAVQSRKKDLVELLLKNGANYKVQDDIGETLIQFAKKQHCGQDLIQLLRDWPNKERKLTKEFEARRLANQQTSQQNRHRNVRDYTGKRDRTKKPGGPKTN